MADPEQVSILEQGVDAWNQWRSEHPEARIDLSGVDLRKIDARGATISDAEFNGANLREADLSEARLRGAHLEGADLERADLSKADLSTAFLSGAHFQGAELWAARLRVAMLRGAILRDTSLPIADLWGASLMEADLRGANLRGASLWEADLQNADLRGADLCGANLSKTSLWEADLRTARMGYTYLADVDLHRAIGLEEVVHLHRSSLDIDTMRRSKGKIPEGFLRGCGLSDWEIETIKLYDPDLGRRDVNKVLNRIQAFRTGQRRQDSQLYIAYTAADRGFVDQLEQYLNTKGIRSWRHEHETGAEPAKKQVERDYHDQTVILVLSAGSITGDWVQDELRRARDCEVPGHIGRYVFSPLALDESWKSHPWPDGVPEQLSRYEITDFSGWWDRSDLETQLKELIDGLRLFDN